MSTLMSMKYKLEFTHLSDRWKCKLCREVLRDPKQLPCGNRVCESCINKYLADGPRKCPSDELACTDHILVLGTDIYNDKAAWREIMKQEVCCPFELCRFRDKMMCIDQHISMCKYREIKCTKCCKEIIAKDEQEHNRNLCEMRIIQCEYCDKSVKSCELLPIHLNTDNEEMCENYSRICPNNCSQILQVSIKKHLLVCCNKKQKCPFHLINCPTIHKLSKGDLKDHFNRSTISHKRLMIERIHSVERSLDEVSAGIEQNVNVRNEMRNISQKMYKKMKVNFDLVLGNVAVECLHRNADLIWKIEHFDRLSAKAEMNEGFSILSDYFYSDEFGYKFQMRLYPFGFADYYGSHLSVCLELLDGEFDPILSWPFKHEVVIGIFHNETRQMLNCQAITPRIDSPSSLTSLEQAIVSFPEFLSLHELENSFLFPDKTIYLKATINKI